MLTAAVLVPLSKLQVLFLKSWFLSFNASLSGFCFGVGSPPKKVCFSLFCFVYMRHQGTDIQRFQMLIRKVGLTVAQLCAPPLLFCVFILFFYFFLFLLNSSCYAIYAHSLSTDLHICTLYMNEGRCL